MSAHDRKVGVVVPAAGQGRRMGTNRNKQFFELDGTPILLRTLESFQCSPTITTIVLAVSSEEMTTVQSLVRGAGISKVSVVVAGGEERQDSVWNGIEALKNQNVEYVLVHDAVRPFIDQELIERVLNAAVRFGAAVPALRVKETVKRVDPEGIVRETVAREHLWLAQTPQAFEFQLLYRAYRQSQSDNFVGTDDASLVERLGERVCIVEGSSDNIKITTPEDLDLARSILRKRPASQTNGSGSN